MLPKSEVLLTEVMAIRRVDKMFKAFADETRLRVLHLLTRRKELCVCDIMDILRLSQSKVSRHLGYLRSARLVQDRRQGLWSYYSLRKPQSRFHRNLIGCLNGCFDEVSTLRRDRERLAKFNGNERCP